MLKVSLAVITLNEERNIERCLRSASWVNDIVVLDSGSQDRTREIATSLGARVFNEKWRGFRSQKERAVELCQYDWILSLDADETLSDKLSKELQNYCQQSDISWDALEFPRLSYYLGRWVRYGGWFPDYQQRFFHRQKATWVGGHVHERIQATTIHRSSSCLLHFPFESLTKQVETNNRYSGLGAQKLFDSEKKFSTWQLCLKPLSKFIETYIIKRGFLDGKSGFIISVGAAYSVFLKWAKLWEIENQPSWPENPTNSPR